MEPAHSQTMTPNLPWSLLGGAEVDLSYVDVEAHVVKYLTIKFVPYKIILKITCKILSYKKLIQPYM